MKSSHFVAMHQNNFDPGRQNERTTKKKVNTYDGINNSIFSLWQTDRQTDKQTEKSKGYLFIYFILFYFYFCF